MLNPIMPFKLNMFIKRLRAVVLAAILSGIGSAVHDVTAQEFTQLFGIVIQKIFLTTPAPRSIPAPVSQPTQEEPTPKFD